jgi:hypothetical protein
MTAWRLLYQLARADFLQRVRSYGFLIALGFTAYFCYICLPPNHASYVTLEMGGHRGIYNSAYVGTLVAMETALILSLAGFYLVKNSVERDMRTGVGQILAATPLTKPLYTMGKALSNFAVLAAMSGVIATAAGIMQFARHEETAIRVWRLLAPFLFIVLPVMATVASVAVLFEVVPMLRGGLGNVIYFFLWIFACAALAGLPKDGAWLRGADLMAFSVAIPSIRSACDLAFPGCAASTDFNLGFTFGASEHWDLTTFQWDGIQWSTGILVGRLLWFGAAAGFTLLAATLFHRFDPSFERSGKAIAPVEESPGREATPVPPATTHATLSRLSAAERRFRFGAMVRAELRIALKGVSRWWYMVAILLIVGGLVSPPVVSRALLVAAWIWPILIWSALGTREERQHTSQLVFSTPHPLRRQLPACWLAGMAIALLTGLGPALRLLAAGNGTGLAAWLTGAFFIPTLALALGVWSGSSKLFEVIYVLLWYIGPVNQLSALDYMGVAGGSPSVFLLCTLVLAVLAVAGRQRQIRL